MGWDCPVFGVQVERLHAIHLPILVIHVHILVRIDLQSRLTLRQWRKAEEFLKIVGVTASMVKSEPDSAGRVGGFSKCARRYADSRISNLIWARTGCAGRAAPSTSTPYLSDCYAFWLSV